MEALSQLLAWILCNVRYMFSNPIIAYRDIVLITAQEGRFPKDDEWLEWKGKVSTSQTESDGFTKWLAFKYAEFCRGCSNYSEGRTSAAFESIKPFLFAMPVCFFCYIQRPTEAVYFHMVFSAYMDGGTAECKPWVFWSFLTPVPLLDVFLSMAASGFWTWKIKCGTVFFTAVGAFNSPELCNSLVQYVYWHRDRFTTSYQTLCMASGMITLLLCMCPCQGWWCCWAFQVAVDLYSNLEEPLQLRDSLFSRWSTNMCIATAAVATWAELVNITKRAVNDKKKWAPRWAIWRNSARAYGMVPYFVLIGKAGVGLWCLHTVWTVKVVPYTYDPPSLWYSLWLDYEWVLGTQQLCWRHLISGVSPFQ